MLTAGGKADRVLFNLPGCLGAWDGYSLWRAWQGGVSALGSRMDPVGRLYLRQRAWGLLQTPGCLLCCRASASGRQARKDSHPMRERAPADGGSFLPPGLEAKGLSDQRRAGPGLSPHRGGQQRLDLGLPGLRPITATWWQQRGCSSQTHQRWWGELAGKGGISRQLIL